MLCSACTATLCRAIWPWCRCLPFRRRGQQLLVRLKPFAKADTVLGQVEELYAGEVGYLSASIRSVADARVGDTITLRRRPAEKALPGCLPPTPRPLAAAACLGALRRTGTTLFALATVPVRKERCMHCNHRPCSLCPASHLSLAASGASMGIGTSWLAEPAALALPNMYCIFAAVCEGCQVEPAAHLGQVWPTTLTLCLGMLLQKVT